MKTIEERIAVLRDRSMTKISAAAGSGDIATTVHFSRIVERVSALEERARDLKSSLEHLEAEFEKNGKSGLPSRESSRTPITDSGRVGQDVRHLPSGLARQEGRLARQRYATKLAGLGIDVTQDKPSCWRSKQGRAIGVAYAHEREDKWFLGLPDEPYEAIVLLCQNSDGSVEDFVLDKVWYQKFRGSLSRSNGQLKLNVFRRKGDFYMPIPGTDGSRLDDYRGATEHIRKLQ